MNITEVRIKLMEDSGDRLRAFCSITFDDCFVVRDLKIIEGSAGPFVAMPSRKLTAHCLRCNAKNHLRANYCNDCGAALVVAAEEDTEGRAKLYADIAHPINSACREQIQNRVIDEYELEIERSLEPGYRSRYDDFFPDDGDDDYRDGQSGERAPEGEQKPATYTTEGGAVRKIDAPQRQAPSPHTAPTGAESDKSRPKPSGGFGAGIFDQ